MAKEGKTTLLVLLDAFRSDYLNKDDTPFLWELKNDSVWVKTLINPGRYCERSVFMTGAGPEKTGNYFAMSLMPPGYKRAEWEPTFNIPLPVRARLAMTEDVKPDFEPYAFKVESFWDVMREEGKTWAVEACVCLGIKSYQGKTTHGSRPLQLVDRIPEKHDLYYIQYSETDQLIHELGTGRKERRGLLKSVDGSVEWLVEKFREAFGKVDIIIFGDHGMMDVTQTIDLPLEYPPYVAGYDYFFLKSSAAIQFWTFDGNIRVDRAILADPKLRQYGKFVKSPSKEQGDIIWVANPGILLSPCHFHGKGDRPKAMHGYDEYHPDMKGMAIIHDGKHKGQVEEGNLKDICPNVCDLVGVRYPKENGGVSYVV